MDDDAGRAPDWLAAERDRRFRGWSIGLGVTAPLLGFLAFLIVLGADLQSSTSGDLSATDVLVFAVVAVVLGVVVPLAGAVALVVLSRRVQLPPPGGAVVAGAAGLLAALLLLPWLLTAAGDVASQRAALARAPAAERQDPEEMRTALLQVVRHAVRALPDAQRAQADDESSGRLTTAHWWEDDCRLSVGGGREWHTPTRHTTYTVADVRAALDAVAEDATARGLTTAFRTDGGDGELRDLQITVPEGRVFVGPEANADVTHDAGEIEVQALTQCVR